MCTNPLSTRTFVKLLVGFFYLSNFDSRTNGVNLDDSLSLLFLFFYYYSHVFYVYTYISGPFTFFGVSGKKMYSEIVGWWLGGWWREGAQGTEIVFN